MKRKTPILVVDDDAVSREILSDLLGRNGYEVSTATNGRQALHALSAGDFRLATVPRTAPTLIRRGVCWVLEKSNRVRTPVARSGWDVDSRSDGVRRGEECTKAALGVMSNRVRVAQYCW